MRGPRPECREKIVVITNGRHDVREIHLYVIAVAVLKTLRNLVKKISIIRSNDVSI